MPQGVPLTPSERAEILRLYLQEKWPQRRIAYALSITQKGVSHVIVAAGHGIGRNGARKRLALPDMPGDGAPVCRGCRGRLSFETDWLGRLLEWCPNGCQSPSTCNPRTDVFTGQCKCGSATNGHSPRSRTTPT